MDHLNNKFSKTLLKILAGGGKKAQERLKETNKLTVRERINKLLDPNSPFLELS